MKANEFIKKHGLAEAKRVLHDARGCVGVKLWDRYEFSTDDLKRLIESHELVESLVHIYKSVEIVKEKASYCGCTECKSRLQAIADVESCMGEW